MRAPGDPGVRAAASGPRRRTRASAGPVRGDAHEVAHRRLDLAVDGVGQPERGDGLDVEALVCLEQLERLEREAGAVGRRPGTAPAHDATERRHPAVRLGRLEHPVALDTPVHLGPLPELVREVHLVPAGDAAGGHAGVQQLVGAVQEGVQRLVVALLQPAVGELARYSKTMEPVHTERIVMTAAAR